MSETGVVVQIKGDQVLIEMEASRDCEACGACRYTSTGRMITPIFNSLRADIGDVVKIEIEPQTVLTAAAVVYMLPIILFFAGYGVGVRLAGWLAVDAGNVGIFAGVVFFALSFVLIRNIDNRAKISRRFEPKMCDIIRKNQFGGI